MDAPAARMDFAKRAAIQLLIIIFYVLLIYLTFRFAVAFEPRGRAEHHLELAAVAGPAALCGYAYAKTLGVMPPYSTTWVMGMVFTAANVLVLMMIGAYPDWLKLETDLLPMQQLGILTIALVTSIAVLAGLFRLGGVFARQGNISLR